MTKGYFKPAGNPLSVKDSSVLSSEDSIQYRRRMRENMERDFAIENMGYPRY
jgi:hypothetical protein